MIDPQQIKANSERIILDVGGCICDWLPCLDHRTPRGREAVIGRALVLNAMLQIAFQAPIPAIRDWLNTNDVINHLSAKERLILDRSNAELTQQEVTDLYWYIESLWALLWVGGLIDELAFNEPVQDYMASLCPKLQRNEDSSKFADNMLIRPYAELFAMLDLYYRLHWWVHDSNLKGDNTGNVRIDIVMERRKALAWVMDDTCDWDNVNLCT